ncbi:formyltransferase family protein [Mitsuaria sp. GD03876]|uniref:formyltransferase family protein n=1 Tax=Mitsuaria sp. GD03876 TaxID=2975399 RepID=UPI002446B6DC|nr:formyltransferase family protein [Mitsuaria sp. GD03876]MDH0865604.1 formyltransferase family protein [Mitsuaria sp. GD03876]
MRFAYLGDDSFGDVLTAALRDGHELVELFTEEDDGEQVAALAGSLGVPVQFDPIGPEDMARLQAKGVDLVLSASYSHKVPDWRGHCAYGINIHPSPLPEGRGPAPLPHLILKGFTQSAITVHELSAQWDGGAVVARQGFDLAPDENLTTLLVKSRHHAAAFIGAVLADLPARWERRAAQSAGTYWRMPVDADRTLDLAGSVAQATRMSRAFHGHGVVLRDGDRLLLVDELHGWTHPHGLAPGQEVPSMQQERVFAVRDGFITLIKYKDMP